MKNLPSTGTCPLCANMTKKYLAPYTAVLSLHILYIKLRAFSSACVPSSFIIQYTRRSTVVYIVCKCLLLHTHMHSIYLMYRTCFNFATIIIPEFCACFWTSYYCAHMTVWLDPPCEWTSSWRETCEEQLVLRKRIGQGKRNWRPLFPIGIIPILCIIPEAIDCCFVPSSIHRICHSTHFRIPASLFVPTSWAARNQNVSPPLQSDWRLNTMTPESSLHFRTTGELRVFVGDMIVIPCTHNSRRCNSRAATPSQHNQRSCCQPWNL